MVLVRLTGPVRLGLAVGRLGLAVGRQRGEQRPQFAQHLRRIGGTDRGLVVMLASPLRAGFPPGLPP
jgi:hypothetical protein